MASTVNHDGACPHLGRCDDPDSYFSFATGGNCCFSGTQPSPIESAHQEKSCLGGGWRECPRYRLPLVRDDSPGDAPLGRSWKYLGRLPTPVGVTILAVIVLGVLIGIWLLGMGPENSNPVSMTAPAGAVTTTVEATHAPVEAGVQTITLTPAPTRTIMPSRTPSPSPTATRTPTISPTLTPTMEPTMTPTRILPLTLSVTVPGNGTLVRIPDGASYTYGTEVKLRPVAGPGWSFVGWLGSDAGDLTDNGDGTWSLTMDGNKEITAIFTEELYYVVARIDGAGTVVNSPGNPYEQGQTATFRPLADPGWRFDSWSGPDAPYLIDNRDGSWSLLVDENKEITAVFVQEQ
jgi:hypothetical protein